MNEELKNYLMFIPGILKDYKKIHAEIFPTQLGIFNKIKKIFIPIEFNKFVPILKELIKQLSMMIENSKNLKKNNSLSDNDKILLEFLLEYFMPLNLAISKLLEICEKLYKKSTNENQYPLSEYNKDVFDYENFIKSYQEIMEKLQEQNITNISTEYEKINAIMINFIEKSFPGNQITSNNNNFPEGLILFLFYFGAIDVLTQNYKINKNNAINIYSNLLQKIFNYSENEAKSIINDVIKNTASIRGEEIMAAGVEAMKQWVSGNKIYATHKLKELIIKKNE